MNIDNPSREQEDIRSLNFDLEKISGRSFRFYFNRNNGFMMYPIAPEYIKIGGIGITNRNLSQVIYSLGGDNPDELKRAINYSDSIIFFGNGMSLAPLELKRRFPQKRVVVVDMIDYYEIVDIYINRRKTIRGINKCFPAYKLILLEYFTQAQALVAGSNNGSIEIYRHIFGTGNPPIVGNFDLGLNCYGPPEDTISEQLRLIGEKGVIYLREVGAGRRIASQSEI